MARKKQKHSSDDDLSAEDFEATVGKRFVASKKKQSKNLERRLTSNERQELDQFYSQEQFIGSEAVKTTSSFRFYPNAASTPVDDLVEDDKNWLFLRNFESASIKEGTYLLTGLKISATVYNYLSPSELKVLDPFLIPQGCTAKEAEKAFIANDHYFSSLSRLPPGSRQGMTANGTVTSLSKVCSLLNFQAVFRGPDGKEVLEKYQSYFYGIPSECLKIVSVEKSFRVYLDCRKLLLASESCLCNLGNLFFTFYQNIPLKQVFDNPAVLECDPANAEKLNLKYRKILGWMLNQESDRVEHFVRKLDSHLILKVDDQLVSFVDGTVTKSISAYWNEPLAYIHGGAVFSSNRLKMMEIFIELILQNPLEDMTQLSMVEIQKKFLLPSRATLIYVQDITAMSLWEKYFKELQTTNPSLVVITSKSCSNLKISDIMFADVIITNNACYAHAENVPFYKLRADIPIPKEVLPMLDFEKVNTVIEGFPASLNAKLADLKLNCFYYHRIIYDTKETYCNGVAADWKWFVQSGTKDLSLVQGTMLNNRSTYFDKTAVIEKFFVSI